MATVLNEIENSRTYYWKGRVLSERGNQVEDQSFPTFLDMNQMFTAFGEVRKCRHGHGKALNKFFGILHS